MYFKERKPIELDIEDTIEPKQDLNNKKQSQRIGAL